MQGRLVRHCLDHAEREPCLDVHCEPYDERRRDHMYMHNMLYMWNVVDRPREIAAEIPSRAPPRHDGPCRHVPAARQRAAVRRGGFRFSADRGPRAGPRTRTATTLTRLVTVW